MNKQKLISTLQSRVAKRKKQIAYEWFIFHYEGCEFDWDEWDKIGGKELAIRLGYEQKVDKQLLRQLIVDERELKLLRKCAKNLQGRIDTLLGWNK